MKDNKNTAIIISSIVGVLVISLVVTITLFSRAKKAEETRLDAVYSRMSRLESGIETLLKRMEEGPKEEEAAPKTPPYESEAAGPKEGKISGGIKDKETEEKEESPVFTPPIKVDKSPVKEKDKEELKSLEKEAMSACMKYKRDLKKCLSSPKPTKGLIRDFYSKDKFLIQGYVYNYYLCSALKTKEPEKFCKKLRDEGDHDTCMGFYDAWQVISSDEATCDDSRQFNRICNILIKRSKTKVTTEKCLQMTTLLCNAIKKGNSDECKKIPASEPKKLCKKLVEDFKSAARLSSKKGFREIKLGKGIQNSLEIAFKLVYNKNTCNEYLRKSLYPYYCKNTIQIPQKCKEVQSNE